MVEKPMIARAWCDECNAYHYADASPEAVARAAYPVTPELSKAIDEQTRPHAPLPASPAARLQALVDMYNGVPDEDGNLVKLITREQFVAQAEVPTDSEDTLGGALGDTAAFGRAIAAWLPVVEPDGRQFFAVDRSLALARFADRRVAGWLAAALRWPLAMMAGAEHWRRRTGGTLSFDTAHDGAIVDVVATWRAGAWSMTECVWAPDDLEPTDERLEHGMSDLDRMTLAWVDAGCPR